MKPYSNPAQEAAQFVYQYAAEHPEQLSIAVDLIPGVADVRAGVELITGHDYITGKDVSRWEALANFIPGRRALEKVSPCLGFAKLSKKGLTQRGIVEKLSRGFGSSASTAAKSIQRGRFTTVTTYADGTVRRAMNVDVVNEHLKSLTKGKDPILKRMTGDHKRTQGTVTYKVERDSGCLKEGHCIRLDKAKPSVEGANTHAHIEVRSSKKPDTKEPLFKCYIDESGEFVMKGDL